MTQLSDSNGSTTPAVSQRYRLPGISREGIAQLSLLETAIWPLKGGKLDRSTFETTYAFTTADGKRQAAVSVFAPLGLQSIDEYVLWGLLGVTLGRPNPDPTLLATPYWLLKRLNLAVGGFGYEQLRASLERLATVAYQNTGFWNPLTQRHERVTFHFFSSFLPTRGRGGPVATDRAWRVEWDARFFALCRATGGTLLFDLDLYRKLSPAARRLFLKLKDRFWRTKRVFLNVDDLTINGLGFSAERPRFKRKYDLTGCIRELLDQQVIELGTGQCDPRQLFLKRSKDCSVVVFYEGEYFRRPCAARTMSDNKTITDDPLYEPLRKIGVDEAAIRRIFQRHARGLIQKWVKVTDAAMHEAPRGFPGFKVSPAAFLVDALQNQRLPPDWIYAHEKEQRREQWERERIQQRAEEEELRRQYDHERGAALAAFLQSPEGRKQQEQFYPTFVEFYRIVDPYSYRERATEAATGKVEREHFQFPEFSVWLLDRPGSGTTAG